MNVQELRIGNFIFASNDQAEVMEIYSAGLSLIIHPYVDPIVFKHPIEHISGILLTDEWFDKFGFHSEHDSLSDAVSVAYVKKHMGIDRIEEEVIFLKMDNEFYLGQELQDCRLWPVYPVQLRFVHQLQNMYFVCSEHELTIKE